MLGGMEQRVSKIYVSASGRDIAVAKETACRLFEKGMEVVSRWHETPFQLGPHDDTPDVVSCAAENLADINGCDAMLIVGESPSTGGGLHFEAGYALAHGKFVFCQSERHCRSNLFLASSMFCRDVTRNTISEIIRAVDAIMQLKHGRKT